MNTLHQKTASELSGMDWHIEEYTDDPNRVRVVSSVGASAWFSRLQHTDDKGVLVIPIRYILEAFKGTDPC